MLGLNYVESWYVALSLSLKYGLKSMKSIVLQKICWGSQKKIPIGRKLICRSLTLSEICIEEFREYNSTILTASN